MINIKLQGTDDKGIETEVIPLQFQDEEVKLLTQYLENCDRLASANIFKEKFPFVKNIRWTAKHGMTFDVTEFDYSQVCELLHLARPILLLQEPASFKKTQAIFGRKSKNTFLAKHLRFLRETYDRGEYQPYYQIKIGGTPLFHEETIRKWLNGVEYHQDEEKAKIIKKLEESLSEETVRGIFVAQLSGVIRATFMLADLAKLVVNNDS